MTVYCGRVDSTGAGGVHGLDEEDEDILVRAISYEELWRWYQEGRINTAIPIIAVQWLAIHRQRLREEWGAERQR